MKNTIAGTLVFGLFAASPSMLLSISALWYGPQRRNNPWDDFLFMGYYLGMTTGLAALGFLVATAFSPRWRQTQTLRAVAIAGLLGLSAPLVHLAVLAATAWVVLPLFRAGTSPAAVMAMIISNATPGVVLGGVAHLLLKLTRRERPYLAAG